MHIVMCFGKATLDANNSKNLQIKTIEAEKPQNMNKSIKHSNF